MELEIEWFQNFGCSFQLTVQLQTTALFLVQGNHTCKLALQPLHFVLHRLPNALPRLIWSYRNTYTILDVYMGGICHLVKRGNLMAKRTQVLHNSKCSELGFFYLVKGDPSFHYNEKKRFIKIWFVLKLFQKMLPRSSLANFSEQRRRRPIVHIWSEQKDYQNLPYVRFWSTSRTSEHLLSDDILLTDIAHDLWKHKMNQDAEEFEYSNLSFEIQVFMEMFQSLLGLNDKNTRPSWLNTI